MRDKLIQAMADLDEQRTLSLVDQLLKNNATAMDIVELCRRGVEIVGERYRQGIYYLSDLIMSEEIMREVIAVLEPHFPVGVEENEVTIVMGTIEGDIHDLGKNIVIYLLRSAGYKVIDLGVDVPPERFVEAVSNTKAQILGICVLLTFCVGAIKKVVDLLQETGLRDRVKIMVGGYPVDRQVKEFTGVDYYTNDGTKALEIVKEILAR